jgi:hypothetical protein
MAIFKTDKTTLSAAIEELRCSFYANNEKPWYNRMRVRICEAGFNYREAPAITRRAIDFALDVTHHKLADALKSDVAAGADPAEAHKAAIGKIANSFVDYMREAAALVAKQVRNEQEAARIGRGQERQNRREQAKRG